MEFNELSTSSNPLRVVFCTSGGLYGAFVLRQLLACKEIEVCGIVRSSRTNNISENFLIGALRHIRRSGIRYALYLFYSTTLSDIICKIKKILPLSDYRKKVAFKSLTTQNINNQKGMQFLIDCKPDLLISAFFNQKFSEKVLSIPLKGGINIHPSLLPMHKGVDPVLQCCLSDDPFGVTVHMMTPELDAGAILMQEKMSFSKSISIFEVTACLFNKGGALLVEKLRCCLDTLHAQPQNEAGSYESWPKAIELKKIKQKKIPLVRFKDLSLFS